MKQSLLKPFSFGSAIEWEGKIFDDRMSGLIFERSGNLLWVRYDVDNGGIAKTNMHSAGEGGPELEII